MDLETARKTPFAWPGGYAILSVMDDGGTLCFDCLQNESVHEDPAISDGWRYTAHYIHWEGESTYCDHCNKVLESEYGDPEK